MRLPVTGMAIVLVVCATIAIAQAQQQTPNCWTTRACTASDRCTAVRDDGTSVSAKCGTGCAPDSTAEGSIGCSNRAVEHVYTNPGDCRIDPDRGIDCRYYCSEAVRVGIGCCTTTCPDPLHDCKEF